MRIYSVHHEENIRDGHLAREWTASGLLDSTQSAALQSELQTDLRQTNGFLRAALFVFASLMVIAGIALVADTLRPKVNTEWTILFLVSGAVCWVLAEYSASKRLYRYGVEEAMAVLSVVFIAIGTALSVNRPADTEHIVILLVTSIGGLTLYCRFGFVYGAVGAIAAAAAIQFQFGLRPEGERLLAVLVIGAVLALVRRQRLRQPEEPAGSGLVMIEASAWVGVYLMLNLKLSQGWAPLQPGILYSPRPMGSGTATWFYLLTWAMIWILPAAALWLGLHRKERLLIDVGVFMTLLTLSTNKQYLGWHLHPWDPMLLGGLLITAAIAVRRWLNGGANGEQRGFTAVRLLRSDARNLAAISIASSVIQPHATAPGQTQQQAGFHEGGGKSGGGGATGRF